MSWDQRLNSELAEKWSKFRSELKCLDELEIPRWLNTLSTCQSIQLHGFSDASQVAYAAVVFIRVEDDNGFVQVSMVTAKTRVAPIKIMTIPRLELCAAVLLANLLHQTQKSLELSNVNTFAWSDSKIVLAWLKGSPSKWNAFVAHT